MVSVGILVVMVLVMGEYVALIPNAVLAGILVKVALDTIDWRFVMRVHRVQREHMVVMLLTLGVDSVPGPGCGSCGGDDSRRGNQRAAV